MNIRAARECDSAAILQMLQSAGLPSADLETSNIRFLLAWDGERLVGTAGVEIVGPAGLLRSVAVDPEYRSRSVGRELCREALSLARSTGVTYLYLLTTTAEDYFARMGFERVERTAVPLELQATSEFRSLCPATAVCMRLALDAHVWHSLNALAAALVSILALFLPLCAAAQVTIRVERPMNPPAWALQERALLRAYGDAAREFAAKYVDDRGFLRCVERWGGNDGPDDAMENFHYWPLVYALGGPEPLIELYRQAWEGHLVQYTKARAPSIEMARQGMYFKEFITAFDWEHNGEGLAAFEFYSLAAPRDPVYRQRARRFAGFYMNEDPGAPNYDPKHKIIRSLHNGSRGPKLTYASMSDWGGEPEPGDPDRLERYKTAANIRGDHPLNLCATTLAMNAYMLTGERKYRDWVLEYTAAWRDRVMANGGNIPTNIGLDGTIGGEWGGKWYGGTFGWDFWPQSNSRNYYMRGPRIAFGEAFLLTADAAFLEPLRRQIANLYAVKKEEKGRTLLPNKYGEKGWYGYTPDQHLDVQRDLWLWSHQPADAAHLGSDLWTSYLQGRNASFPEKALGDAIGRVRRQVERIRQDDSTPDTRASDYPQSYDPVEASPLTYLTVGGNDPGTSGNILHSRLFWFDSGRRRAGLPEDVAALVEKIGPGEVTVTVVNTNPVYARQAVLRMGAYGEHQCESVAFGGKAVKVDGREFSVELAPGAGETLTIRMRRYANQPSLALPW